LHPVKNQHPGMGIAFKNKTLLSDKASFTPNRKNGMTVQSFHSSVLRMLFAVFCDTKSIQHLLIPLFKKSISYNCLFRAAFLLRLPI